ncbi:hypothetical protein [Frankia sp. AiPa1]|uniref:hypothetical protein n=1 Tax=Frankia sp. AiPa1 TaxID=573492 RepID=UPI00202B8CA7|nr:hypothetical protein [Frankia sp. AiPa1]MCL9759409.1 hypothetical protein [Frankia sp. AiPa1]
MSIPTTDSRTALEEVESALRTLARRWETTPPAELVSRLSGLAHHARTIGRWRLGEALRRDWARAHGRILVMTAVAQGDAGLPARATASARSALVLARHVGDSTTVAHARVALAELAAYAFESTDDGLLLARSARATAPHSHTAILAITTEAHIMAARNMPVAGIVERLRAADAIAATLPAGTPGYSLDGIHPAYLPTFGGAALVAAGSLAEGERLLDEAAGLFDRSRASGALAAVRLYQASAAMRGRDLERAQMLATTALAASAVRPSSWLSNGILTLAQRARRQGADWSGLVVQAKEWSPL